MSEDAPIHKLEGRTTGDGWRINALVRREAFQTGGNFSVGYRATHADGREAFFKAIDLRRAMSHPDPMRALDVETSAYQFERRVLQLCKGSRLNRIVTAISDGFIDVPGAPLDRIFYLIFELANGDVRQKVFEFKGFDLVWVLSAMHDICVGLSQLHGRGIYHQDVKPSNVLTFGEAEASKLADLGRAHCRDIAAPHDILEMPGVRYYAPPEQMYGYYNANRSDARAAADLYLAGSMLFYFVTGEMLSPVLLRHLRAEHRPPVFSATDGGWGGTYEEVLPFIRQAFTSTLSEFQVAVEKVAADPSCQGVRDELRSIVTSLCDPDPFTRGHPGLRSIISKNRYSVERYISQFAKLILAANVAVRRQCAAA